MKRLEVEYDDGQMGTELIELIEKRYDEATKKENGTVIWDDPSAELAGKIVHEFIDGDGLILKIILEEV